MTFFIRWLELPPVLMLQWQLESYVLQHSFHMNLGYTFQLDSQGATMA